MNPLEYWWIGVLLGGPLAALFGGGILRRTVSARARWASGLGAVVVLGLAFSPVSLPGVVADHIVLGLACLVMWLWLGGSQPIVRYGAVAAFGGIVGLLFVRAWPLFPLVSVLGDLTRPPSQTLRLDCHRVVRMTGYGWVARSGTEVVAVARPFGLPLEVELGRRRFDDSEYERAGLSAKATPDGAECPVVVMYEGTEVWRVR